MAPDPLAHLYPVWEANCRESARWLRSGTEIEAWYARRGLAPPSPEKREMMAQRYEQDAREYATKITG